VGVLSSVMAYLLVSPSPIDPCIITLSPLESTLDLKDGLLDGANLLFLNYNRTVGVFPSPLRAEAFEEDEEGGFYSGLGDGRIVYIKNNGGTPPSFSMETIIRTGYSSIHCGKAEYEYMCGRPLGLHIHPTRKTLFIADTLGLLELDLKTKTLNVVLKDYQGSPIIFANSIAISQEGIIYFTDSSTKYPRSRVLLDFLEGCPNGRLFSYDPETKNLTKLLDSLYFPNGIQLTPKEDALIFAETTQTRIMKYYLKGPKQGVLEAIVKNINGFPDNIKYSAKSQLYWVGLSPRTLEILFRLPIWMRIQLSKIDIESILKYYPTQEGMAIAIDENGNVVKTLYSPKGILCYLSEIVEIDGFLLVGSWRNDFIGLVDIRGTQNA